MRLAIKRLAAYENTSLTPDEIAALRAELDAAQRRAEAAVRDMQLIANFDGGPCKACMHDEKDIEEPPCFECVNGKMMFEWRGPDAPSKEAQP